MVTALMTLAQVRQVAEALAGGAHSYISVFAGRIADTGPDPVPLMAAAVQVLEDLPNAELVWASPRNCSTSPTRIASAATSSRSLTTF